MEIFRLLMIFKKKKISRRFVFILNNNYKFTMYYLYNKFNFSIKLKLYNYIIIYIIFNYYVFLN